MRGPGVFEFALFEDPLYCIAHVAFAFRSGVEGFNFTFKKR